MPPVTSLHGLLSSGGHLLDRLINGGGSGPGAPGPSPEIGFEPLASIDPAFAIASLALTAVFAAGTRHITRHNVLDHDARQAMYEYIWETGAAHLRRIADTLDLSTTNATWHLDKLKDAGLIAEVKVNGYRMYYPKGGGKLLREHCFVAGHMQSENARDVLEYVQKNPGSHQRRIARALDINHGTARWHLSRLAENGLLESQKEGRMTTYRISEKTERVLTQMPPLQMESAAEPA